jgi:serine/threonine protein kinase
MEGSEKLKMLGHGSFGRVWKARHKSDGQTVVIKEIDFSTMQRHEKQLFVKRSMSCAI